jgi:hypothetical protein
MAGIDAGCPRIAGAKKASATDGISWVLADLKGNKILHISEIWVGLKKSGGCAGAGSAALPGAAAGRKENPA